MLWKQFVCLLWVFSSYSSSILSKAQTIELTVSQGQWEAWKLAYGRKYVDLKENVRREAIWRANLKKIQDHNIGNHSYTLAMNQFGDLTENEYRETMLRNKFSTGVKRNGSTFLPPSNVELPSTVDWREHGYVTRVKDQGACGACWAFSATGSLEGQHFKKTGKLVELSEQNLVDCSFWYGNRGCNGGLMDNAFRYVADYGIDTEKSYPYVARENTFCWYNEENVGAGCSDHVDIEQFSEFLLHLAVATVGPISVAIDADHSTFQFYSSGVYDETRCSSTKLDHEDYHTQLKKPRSETICTCFCFHDIIRRNLVLVVRSLAQTRPYGILLTLSY
ncbi:procathepsin L-like isoform X2 [Xenia sp. Carnegie-2017]|uniref:procathepsin L-like isoform X2 n=1 Tax=Xenia sp. Carnegie-2017 TaxID=2897299 RepID=UPI001F036F7B|nr:procathepsin L-like isoform X2 [Xenia sp. Carnegie-2017]